MKAQRAPIHGLMLYDDSGDPLAWCGDNRSGEKVSPLPFLITCPGCLRKLANFARRRLKQVKP